MGDRWMGRDGRRDWRDRDDRDRRSADDRRYEDDRAYGGDRSYGGEWDRTTWRGGERGDRMGGDWDRDFNRSFGDRLGGWERQRHGGYGYGDTERGGGGDRGWGGDRGTDRGWGDRDLRDRDFGDRDDRGFGGDRGWSGRDRDRSYGHRGYGGSDGGGFTARDRAYGGRDFGPDRDFGRDFGRDRGGPGYGPTGGGWAGGSIAGPGGEGGRDLGEGPIENLWHRAKDWFQGRGRGPKRYVRPDERIRDDVYDRLMSHPWIDATDVEVQVKDGEVTLLGTVNSREDKREIEDIADAVLGVKDVHNQLRRHRADATSGAGTSGAGATSGPTGLGDAGENGRSRGTNGATPGSSIPKA